MAKRKGSGFIYAFGIALVSFLVIFFFFTDVSDKYFGVSYKGDAKETFERVITEENINKVVDTTTEKAKDVLSDISSLIGTPEGL